MSGADVSLPGPLAFAVVAAVAGIVCYLVQRWTFVAGLVAVATCLGLGWFALQWDPAAPVTFLGRTWALDESLVVLGREWAFTPANTGVLALMLFAGGLSFLGALAASQGTFYYPFGLAVVSALTLSVTAQLYVYAILFLWLAAILGVFVLSGGRPRTTVGAVRFLALTSIAVMMLLTMTGYVGEGSDAAMRHTGKLLAIVGFAMLFMLVPFHGQLVGAVAHTAPMVPAALLSAFPPVVLYLLFALGRAHPDLFADRLLFDLCRWLGVATVVLGGIAATCQRRWSYLVAYATMVDWGTAMIALGQGTPESGVWAVQMLFWRALSLLLVGTGLTVITRVTGPEDTLAASSGLLQRRLFALMALVGGLLSLGGLPLTPGFAGRAPLLASLLISHPGTAWVIVLGGTGVCVGAVSGLRACLGPAEQPAGERRWGRERFELLLGVIAPGLALSLVAVLTLRPTYWIEMVQRIATAIPL